MKVFFKTDPYKVIKFFPQNDELKKTCSDLEIIKGRITQENVEITRQLEEQESKKCTVDQGKEEPRTTDGGTQEKQLEDENEGTVMACLFPRGSWGGSLTLFFKSNFSPSGWCAPTHDDRT